MQKLQHYLANHATVPGWLDAFSARFIADVSRIQCDAGHVGSVGEIGVHMGRLFILLKLLARPTEKAIAIDLFHDQHLNIDGSGHGDEQNFKDNVAFWASTANLDILQRSSLAVSAQDILDRVGPCRIFSVDGGHTAQCTLNDLRLADEVLTDTGILILDDYFNPSWPDVSIGAAQFLSQSSSGLRPLAITPNKLFLTRPGAHAFYAHALRQSQSGYFEKSSEMFGSAVAIFGVEPQTYGLKQRLRRWAKSNHLEPVIRVARQRWRNAFET